MDSRSKIQQEAIQAWMPKKKGILLLGTGMGKSKLAIDVLKKLYPKGLNEAKVLLLVNSQDLRDRNWFKEFKEWNALEWYKDIVRECYQTVYKWKDTNWDLVISDEFDVSLSPEYVKFYLNNTFNMFFLTL